MKINDIDVAIILCSVKLNSKRAKISISPKPDCKGFTVQTFPKGSCPFLLRPLGNYGIVNFVKFASFTRVAADFYRMVKKNVSRIFVEKHMAESHLDD